MFRRARFSLGKVKQQSGVSGCLARPSVRTFAQEEKGQDYSHHGDLFTYKIKRPNTGAPARQIKQNHLDVAEADVKKFWERGYLLHPKPLLDSSEVAYLRDEFDRLFEGQVDYACVPQEYEFWLQVIKQHAQNSPALRKINNAWWISSSIRQIALSPQIGFVAAKLLKTPEIRIWHDQAILKPGLGKFGKVADQNVGNAGWHQDVAFWGASGSDLMVTAFVVLQDTDLSNGGLRTITGSHRWGLQNSATFFETDMEALKGAFQQAAQGKAWEDEACVMKAGQVAFHHSLTFHGSGPNHTKQDRLAIAVHMQADECFYKPGLWHSNVRELGPTARSGQKFDGPAFPPLWSAKSASAGKA